MIVWITAAWASPLTLDTVLAAVDERVPQLAAADAKQAEVEAKLLATRGSFDPQISGKVSAYDGPYDRQITDLSVGWQSVYGPSLQAGWLRGVGEFPTYDERKTSEAGEWRVGVVFPLLDGLLVGPERTALLTASLAAEIARADRIAKQVEVRRKASETWAKWTAAGAKLAVERQLLEVAEARAAALERQVQTGARARLDQVDNERVVLERRDKVAQATGDLAAAALALSLWYRDPSGAPIAPSPAELPPLDALPSPGAAGSLDETPLLRALDQAVASAEAELSRARNAMWPALDLYAQADVDVAAQDEVEVGARVKFGGLMRKERGERDRAGAVVDRLQAERAAAADRLTAEVKQAQIAVQAAEARLTFAREAQEAADEVLLLEQRRVELGGTDLFNLLVRESAVANTRRAVVDAWTEHALAVIDYQALVAIN